MPIVESQLQYPVTGTYEGTKLVSPAKIGEPDTTAIVPVSNVVAPILNSTADIGAGNREIPAKIQYKGYGQIDVDGQPTLVANTYMDNMTFVAGSGMTITTSVSNSTVTFDSLGSSVNVLGGNSIAVDQIDTVFVVNNTMTETVYEVGNVSGTFAPDRDNGTIQKLTLTGNLILEPATNVGVGQSLTLIITQDDVGNRTLSANTAYLFASGYNVLSTNAGDIDMLNMFYDGTNYYVTLTVSYS